MNADQMSLWDQWIAEASNDPKLCIDDDILGWRNRTTLEDMESWWSEGMIWIEHDPHGGNWMWWPRDARGQGHWPYDNKSASRPICKYLSIFFFLYPIWRWHQETSIHVVCLSLWMTAVVHPPIFFVLVYLIRRWCKKKWTIWIQHWEEQASGGGDSLNVPAQVDRCHIFKLVDGPSGTHFAIIYHYSLCSSIPFGGGWWCQKNWMTCV